jgi:hypothetical protein
MIITKAWQRFLDGQWVKKAPKRPGNYPVADQAGHYAGEIEVIRTREKELLAARSVAEPPHRAWAGWWWSAPLPRLPKPKKWDSK